MPSRRSSRRWSRLNWVVKTMGGLLPDSERVTLHVVEQVDQSTGRGTATFATLGVEWQAFDRLTFHGATQLAFEQRFGQEHKKINTEQAPGSGWPP